MTKHLNFMERIVLFVLWPLIVAFVGIMFVIAFCLLVVCWPLVLVPRIVRINY